MTHEWSGWALALVIAGLALSTFLTRASFLLAGSRVRLNPRIEAALRYAPVCTLAAIIAPEVLLHGRAALWLCWSRNIVGCLAVGMLGYSLARLWL